MPGYGNCEYIVANLADGLPFESHIFNAVCLADVLEHMESPEKALKELIRVVKPGGSIIISTPLRGSLFKRLSGALNKATGGRLFRNYYRGKGTELDVQGKPVMVTKAGHDHVSEMSYRELLALFGSLGLAVRRVEMMSVMSGSRWFDQHPFLLSFLLFLEAIHSVLRIPSWAHSICVQLNTPQERE